MGAWREFVSFPGEEKKSVIGLIYYSKLTSSLAVEYRLKISQIFHDNVPV